MLTDFHTHTLLSDGVLIPAEHLRRLIERKLNAVAITDHVDSSTIDHVLSSLDKIRTVFQEEIDFLPGVEITHVLPSKIPELARKAKKKNFLVVVHGETIVEPVLAGTNYSAVSCPDVDILAHPGIITQEEVEIAKKNDVFLEISTRSGHSLGNGLVAKLSLEIGAKLILNTDSHQPKDFLNERLAKQTAQGAGIPESYYKKLFDENPKEILKRILE
ncbi:MAG: histidinol phosphate phosphatase domain-containing protein [Candidatus Heimdallarchaeaceae archaeon]